MNERFLLKLIKESPHMFPEEFLPQVILCNEAIFSDNKQLQLVQEKIIRI